MSAQHTPGPWVATGQASGNYRIVFSERGNWLAEVFADGEWPDTIEADARLIAAAPELLQALKEQVAECFCEDCEMCARHEAVIAKATGAA